MVQYKLEVVKSLTATPQIYELSISLDEIIEMCRKMWKANINLYLTDSQDNDIAHREFGQWHISE